MLLVDGVWTQLELVCVWMNYVKSPNHVFCKHEKKVIPMNGKSCSKLGKWKNQGQMDVCWKA